jgi:hypothetical protein
VYRSLILIPVPFIVSSGDMPWDRRQKSHATPDLPEVNSDPITKTAMNANFFKRHLQKICRRCKELRAGKKAPARQ